MVGWCWSCCSGMGYVVLMAVAKDRQAGRNETSTIWIISIRCAILRFPVLGLGPELVMRKALHEFLC